MRVLDSLWRFLKLGVFVGWGAALTVLSACSSATVKPDSHQGDVKPPPVDAGQARDSTRPAEARAGDQKASPDRRSWDIPLE